MASQNAEIWQRPNRLQTYSELSSDRDLLRRASARLDGKEMKDFRALVATDRRDWLLMAGSLSTTWETTTAAERRAYQRIATHLMCAARLRWALLKGESPAEEAVLSPGGELLHAEGQARSRGARQQLREAARCIDRARGRLRNRPMEALEMWQGIVDGRWSLIDRFDSDGRRTVIAVRNDSPYRDPRGLTRRQGQVAHLIALGMSHKEIAYALGANTSTIAGHAAALMRKLNVTRREELIGLLRSAPVRTSSFHLDGFEVGVASAASHPPELPELSNSEQEVASAVARGLSDHEIAAWRGRSVRTIANQLRSIFRKVGVKSRTELAAKMASRVLSEPSTDRRPS